MTHTLQLPFGTSHLSLSVPHPQSLVQVKYDSESRQEEKEIIKDALRHPIGTNPLNELCRERSNVVILISDMTRLTPTHRFLPYLLDELLMGEVRAEQIRIIVALGTHRVHTENELRTLVGNSIYTQYTVQNHSSLSEECVFLGTTSSGTPVEINRYVAEADFVIATGCIEPHRLAGISGGVKSLFPGTASTRSIEHNHSFFMTEQIEPGNMQNRIHNDFLEVLQFKKIDFILNVIVDHERQILDAVAGDCIEAHQAGAQIAKKRFMVPVYRKFPYTLVSPGGTPKDLHLYQVLKTIQNASEITRTGGTILCAAPCAEHYGSAHLQQIVDSSKDLDHMVKRLESEFIVGAHKAVTLKKLTDQFRIELYSEMPPALVERVGLIPISSLQDRLSICISQHSEPGAFMPYGAITFPMASQSSSVG
ncbi:nickel-dependent lactate racemase [Marinicrinis lubricantis]|uniref:Nickel-dependent lactate racemase n=1 Tax=Marinicrinis lubricantis TaxID=2086470 RepID=A0ABW1IPQ3_9BACL